MNMNVSRGRSIVRRFGLRSNFRPTMTRFSSSSLYGYNTNLIKACSISNQCFEQKFVVSSVHGYSFNNRCFSSESELTLLEILAREEQEEKDMGNIEMPPELVEIKSLIEQNWRIVENGATTDLFHKNHSHKIHVSFHCQDTVEDAIDEFVDDDDEDPDEEPSSPVRFTVTVTKAGKTLVFVCFSEFGQVRIEGVSTTKTSPETVHENQGILPKTEYQGPDYGELAEDLQGALEVYLDEDCGVNSDIATFIAMFTDYREEICYVKSFLTEAQAIVS